MNKFEQIQRLLTEIIEDGYLIIHDLESDDGLLDELPTLMNQRGLKVKELEAIPVGDFDFSTEEELMLKDLFLRFTLLEKKMNKKLSKNSLSSSSSMKAVRQHKKAKASYAEPSSTSRFLNEHVRG